jgi:hydrogenase 3 maturation protease
MSPSPWQTDLRQLAALQNRPPRIAILGIGNTLRSDDAAGPLVARGLERSSLAREHDSFLIIDAGQAPENTTAELRRFAPPVVLLVDAAEMGEAPGTIRWIEMKEIDGMSASTHTMPLSLLSNYLILELGCEVKILGIQPFSTELGESVSREVLRAVDEVVQGCTESLSEKVTFVHPALN